MRTAECIDGSVEIDLVCEPAFEYRRVPGEWTLSSDRHRADATGGEQALRLQTDMLVGIEAGRARARHVLRAGETVSCALTWSDEALVPTTADEAADQLATTTRFWRDWLARAAIPDHELGPMIQRSALTIKAHLHADGGDGRGAHHLAAGMERLVNVASRLGLYAEEFDAEAGGHLGNFPQAFSHLARVEAAARIILADGLTEVVG